MEKEKNLKAFGEFVNNGSQEASKWKRLEINGHVIHFADDGHGILEEILKEHEGWNQQQEQKENLNQEEPTNLDTTNVTDKE